MKRTLIVAGLIALLLPSAAMAQTASGTLTVTATVQSSINLVFNSNASGVALTGSGTNAATLAFGNVSAYGAVGANITRTVGATSFTVSTPVDVLVSASNSTSANFTLTAQLNAADGSNTWQYGTTTITNGSAASVTATGTYGTALTGPVALTIPLGSTTGLSINNAINFVATAN